MRIAVFLFIGFACFGCSEEEMAKKNEFQRRADAAIARIEELGGTVVWEPDLIAVDLSSTPVTDADLALFQDIPDVQLLVLSKTSTSNQGLHHLEHLSKLETLSLIDMLVTDEGVARLKSILPQIEISTAPPPADAINPFTRKPWGKRKMPF